MTTWPWRHLCVVMVAIVCATVVLVALIVMATTSARRGSAADVVKYRARVTACSHTKNDNPIYLRACIEGLGW
jgi:uncharacterized protein YpmS